MLIGAPVSTFPTSLVSDVLQTRRAVHDHDQRLEAVEQIVAGQAREVLTTLQSCLTSLRQACRSPAPPPAPMPPPALPPPAPVIIVEEGAPLRELEQLGAGKLVEVNRQLAAALARIDLRLAAGELAPLAPKLVGFLDRVKDRLAADLRRLERRFVERRRAGRAKGPAVDPATGQPRPRGRPKGSRNRGPRRRTIGHDGNPIPLGRPRKPALAKGLPPGESGGGGRANRDRPPGLYDHLLNAPHQSPEETRAAG